MPDERRSIPDFLYGTAWKEDRTPLLTELALRMGFRGIDTANQRRLLVPIFFYRRNSPISMVRIIGCPMIL